MADFVSNFDISSLLELSYDGNRNYYSNELYAMEGFVEPTLPTLCSTCDLPTDVHDNEKTNGDEDDEENEDRLPRVCEKCNHCLGSPNIYMKNILNRHIILIKKEIKDRKKIPLSYNIEAPVSSSLEDYFPKFILNYFPDSWLDEGIKQCICPGCEKKGTLSVE